MVNVCISLPLRRTWYLEICQSKELVWGLASGAGSDLFTVDGLQLTDNGQFGVRRQEQGVIVVIFFILHLSLIINLIVYSFSTS